MMNFMFVKKLMVLSHLLLKGKFKKDRLPYQALRMIRVDNEDYGRGYVEEFLGDLKSLEGLSQSLVESAGF